MKSVMFMRLAGALLVMGLSLPVTGAWAKGAKGRREGAAADGGKAGEALEGKKEPLGYAEYVRLVSRRRGARHHRAKRATAKAPRVVKAPAKTAKAPVATAVSSVQTVALLPAVPLPRPREREWRPSPEEVREILRTSRNLRGAVLRGANFAGLDLRGAVLVNADLFGANLDGALADGANLRGASLEMASLRGASLRGAKLEGAGLFKADLEGADLAGADLTGVYAVCANLRGVVLATATLRGGVFTKAVVGAPPGAANLATAPFRGEGMERVGAREAVRGASFLPVNGEVARLTF
ncbi:pentapeptide repeat-containing protein [Geobacter sp.]|uniref:pentapeptide repeat-containing protein n=1 Tax=Geobacter sp. TaxID=46610 RepID=UPI002625903B|nr:pentapeptide repeat-containing protein [Geobacter sp.]